MKKYEVIIFASVIILLAIANASALYVQEDTKVDFGHVLRIKSVDIPELSSGQKGIIKFEIQNNGDYPITDLRMKLSLPPQFQFLDDVNEVKIYELKSGESQEISYSIIALPDSLDGIYGATLKINYLTHYGLQYINFGTDNEDNYSFGIIVKSIPSVFMQIDSSDLVTGNTIGTFSLKFVNNGTDNIKFLTVDLMDTPDYEVISEDTNYIGSLDSDDFQTVTYKIKLNSAKDSISLPVKVSYRDPLNNLYSQELVDMYRIRSSKDNGGSSSNNYYFLIGGIVVLIIIVIFVLSRFRRQIVYKK